MASEVDIWSIALAHLGNEPITLYDDPGKPARLCRLLYPGVRDAVLRAYPWRCARAEKLLARLATAPSSTYTYGYQLPTDPWCLWVPKMLNEDLEYQVMGRYLLSDESSVRITFIRRVTDPGMFDSLLSDTIAERLASDLAWPITGVSGLGESILKKYMLKLAEARTMDAMEGDTAGYESNPLVECR